MQTKLEYTEGPRRTGKIMLEKLLAAGWEKHPYNAIYGLYKPEKGRGTVTLYTLDEAYSIEFGKDDGDDK